jgi:predicted Zn-dependent protease
LLKEYPVTPFLHYVYGTALASLSQYTDAELQFKKETMISPTSELPYIQLASIALRQLQPNDALPSGQRAVQLAPRSAEAHYILGRTYLELEQFAAAVQELETGKELAPTSPEIRFNLARAYAKSKLPEKAEQERKEFERLKSLNDQQRDAVGNQTYTRFPSD